MKIVFITPEFVSEPDSYDGGLSNYIYRACLSLKMLGHEPIVVVPADETKKLIHNGLTVHRVNTHISPWRHPLFSITNYSKPGFTWLYKGWLLNDFLKQVVKQQRIDIVQYASYTAPGYFRISSIPVVVRLSSYEKETQKARGRVELTAEELALIKMEGEAIQKADAVFGPSKLVAGMVEKELNVKVSIIETPFTLDINRNDFDNTYAQELKNKRYLLFWGSLGTLKGVGTIVQILKDLLETHKDLYFVFVGKDIDMLPKIRAVQDKVGDQVKVFGRMPHTQLYPLIEGGCAAVLPSRFDNFPNTCIEGMAFGKVVIGTRGTSFEQLIDDGVSGILCEKDNPQDLLKAIERVLGMSDQEKLEIGKNAKKRIEELRPEKVVVELIEFYQEVINKFNKQKHD